MSQKLSAQVGTDPAVVAAQLTGRGLSPEAASEKATLFCSCALAIANLRSREERPGYAIFVPGRIEVLGKHTDYAGGRSLLATAERGFCAVAAPRDDATVRMIDARDGQQAEFQISPMLQPTLGHWSNYPMTVARRLAQNFPGLLRGADVAFVSDIPRASGMSSSSAMVVLSFIVLARINALAERAEYTKHITSPEALAGYLGTVENGQSFGGLAGDRGVGTFGGSEDHTALLCCRPGKLSQYAYCPVRKEREVDTPPDHLFAIASSGVVAEKTGEALEKYNRCSRVMSAILSIWNQRTGRNDAHLAALLAKCPLAVDEVRKVLLKNGGGNFPAHELHGRFEQFVCENQRIVPAAGDAFVSRDWRALGSLVDRSQDMAERFLGNQVPQTIFLAREARQIDAVAASAFGAGFGGSVWALVAKDSAQEFLKAWKERYAARFPECAARSEFFLTRAGPATLEGACRLRPAACDFAMS